LRTGYIPTCLTTSTTLAHLCILEPDRFARVPVWDGGRRGTNAYKAWKAEQDTDDEMKPDDRDLCDRMRDAVMADQEAAHIVNESRHEVSVVWTDRIYGRAKCRMDMLGVTFMADLKTTRTSTPRKFAYQSYDLGNHLQFGWWHEGLAHFGLAGIDTELTCYVVTVENKPPFDVCVYECEPDLLHLGQREAVEKAKAYRAAEITGSFYGVSGGQILKLDLPAFAKPDPDQKPPDMPEMEADEL